MKYTSHATLNTVPHIMCVRDSLSSCVAVSLIRITLAAEVDPRLVEAGQQTHEVVVVHLARSRLGKSGRGLND